MRSNAYNNSEFGRFMGGDACALGPFVCDHSEFARDGLPGSFSEKIGDNGATISGQLILEFDIIRNSDNILSINSSNVSETGVRQSGQESFFFNHLLIHLTWKLCLHERYLSRLSFLHSKQMEQSSFSVPFNWIQQRPFSQIGIGLNIYLSYIFLVISLTQKKSYDNNKCVDYFLQC